jgi:hypothetical protein
MPILSLNQIVKSYMSYTHGSFVAHSLTKTKLRVNVQCEDIFVLMFSNYKLVKNSAQKLL